MKKYVCNVCGYEYDPAKGDPDSGIAPGTAFEDIPEDWVCPSAALPRPTSKPWKAKKPRVKAIWPCGSAR